MPRPPPPATALTKIGKPIFSASPTNQSMSALGSEDFSVGMPARLAARSASTLFPVSSSTSEGGPTKVIPFSAAGANALRVRFILVTEATVLGIARLYAPLAATLVIDEADAALADLVGDEGIRAVVARTVMSEPGVAASLADTVLEP